MEENVLPLQPEFKLHQDRAITIGTFIGGPLVAGYLIAQNYKHLGAHQNIAVTWLITTIATIIIFGSVFLIPDTSHFPNYIIPIAYTALTSYLVRRLQGPQIKQHIEQGGPLYPVGRAVVIGLIGMVVTFGIALGIVLLFSAE